MAVVTFLSDYGLADDFVGVCHGVIARIAPDARVIDITHGIARHDVRAGAIVLRRALAHMPAGVHLAVVDPGVGGSRRAVALRCAGQTDRILVGPDNGLLWLAAERFGGVAEAVDIGRSPLRREPVSASFHGRDVFAPVAAHLAAGTAPLQQAGEPLDPAGLATIELPSARATPGTGLVAHALFADAYGNVMLDADPSQLADCGVRRGQSVTVNGRRATYVPTFGDVPDGELLLYEDSDGVPSLAVNRGSVLETLGLALDDEIVITGGWPS